ncbi:MULTISPECIES: TetR/AcrR family transcriptional regulator [unclassified Lysinibacillus]|uniref:TetR/AcrR family transcriptional regulator n=1 Tax=unclassified Lysinibacillus TaxID=2636778 RepID=UPI0020134995|nr:MULTISPECIES: TetR/AcrR family transcriptional regulator [unclassified Lysinibacillus]MCL1696660.1 TetR/AcrR family transcriptional regulator [Lysinibacillus sp. BPa_S21]MCL1698859.1 TetR/AcrR family transcriptional regulator [Lysinibacillus sp. Bpr_S20]
MSIHDMMNFETKRAIKNALLRQIEEVGFERVTVKNLAITANINRGTFYLHYKDKYEVMEDLQQELLNELESYVRNVQPLDAFYTIKTGQLYQPFIEVFQCIKNHATAFRVILGEQGSPVFSKRMKKVFSHHILDRISVIQGEGLDKEFQQYFEAFLTSAILGVIQEWLDSDDENLNVEELAMIHFRLLRFIGNLASLQQ